MNIWEKVYGNIKISKIIGSSPDVHTLEEECKMQLSSMESKLLHISRSELEHIKNHQIKMENIVNSRPGAMAVSQQKIRIFTKYNQAYIDIIDDKLKTR